MLNGAYRNLNFLKRALDGSWKRSEVINNNIANVNTPGFKKSTVEFEGLLAKELNNNSFDLNVTQSGHMNLNGFGDEKYLIKTDRSTSTRHDGNNVNIDVENSESSKNFIYYNAVAKQMDSQFKRLRNIVSDGRK